MAAESLRYDKHGAVKLMARADVWVMCKRPYCRPFVLKESDWLKLSESPLPTSSPDELPETNHTPSALND